MTNITEIYNHKAEYIRYMFKHGMVRTIDEAEDLFHDVVTKAIEYTNRKGLKDDLKALIFVMIRQERINRYRSQVRQNTDLLKDLSVIEHPLNLYDYNRIVQLCRQSKDGMLALYWAKGYSYEELSGIYRTSIGTVKASISRFRSKLKSIQL